MIMLSGIMHLKDYFYFGKEWIAGLRKIFACVEGQAVSACLQRVREQVCDSAVLIGDSARKLFPCSVRVQVERNEDSSRWFSFRSVENVSRNWTGAISHAASQVHAPISFCNRSCVIFFCSSTETASSRAGSLLSRSL